MAPESPREREPQGLQESSLSIRATKNFPEGKASELAGGRVLWGSTPPLHRPCLPASGRTL